MKGPAQKGFTLIELLAALTVMGVLIVAAMPSFGALTLDKRITTQTNDFISALMLARSESLKRVRRVTVCRSANGTGCTGLGGWEQGWLVFVDTDNDAAVDDGEDILRVHSALDGNNTLRGSTNMSGYISYVASGFTQLTGGGLQAGSVALCDHRGHGEHARNIVVNATGRPRVETALTTCNP